MPAIVSSKPVKSEAKPLGLYLYAVIDSTEDREWATIGIDGGKVYTISEGGISAVVSDVPQEKLRPERRKLAAHHEVLKRLALEHAILPMAFGVIGESTEKIHHILVLNQSVLADQLRRVQGKVEMGLRVCWDVPNIFEYFVDGHAELRLLRDQLFRSGREPTQDDKIELGRIFDRTMNGDRAAHTEKVMNILRPRCAEIQENKPRNEREIMNLACLVRRDAQKEFEQGVFEAAKCFDNHFSFDFNGPWPPHHFVEVQLQME